MRINYAHYPYWYFKNLKRKLKIPLWVLLLIVFVVWLGYLYWAKFHFNGTWNQYSGWFGDTFGAINALFSGLAFAGIIYTILLQKQELKLQRKELKQTRNEFVVQNETLKKQRFESTFFHLIALHNQIVDSLYITKQEHIGASDHTEPKTYNKRDFFTKALADLDTENLRGEYDNPENGRVAIIDAYMTFHFEYAPHLNHYFRNLYHIYKYIHSSKLINREEKDFYSQIIRAQLSDKELTLIFYNMLVPGLGYPNFKFLDQRYDILKNLDYDFWLFDISHLEVFERAYVDGDPV